MRDEYDFSGMDRRQNPHAGRLHVRALTVDVQELQSALPEYLSLVKEGQLIVVTERGRAFARIEPIDNARDEISKERLAALEHAGLLRRGKGGLREALASLERPEDPEGLSLRALLNERDGD